MPTANNQVKFLYGTQDDYDNIVNKDNNSIYITTDTKKIYIGDKLYATSNLNEYATMSALNSVFSDINNLQIQLENIENNNSNSNNNYLTKTDLTICTATEYANMTTIAGTLYLVIDGTSGNQTFTLKDSLGNIIPPYTTSASNGGSLNINTTSVTPNGGNIISSTALVGTVTNLETT